MTSYTPVRLAFKESLPEGGAGGLAPVILAHGFGGDRTYWTDMPQIMANATKRKVYAIDARNHGDSEWSDVFNFDCNEADLLHFMDSIGAPKAIIIGSSMGGVTAIKVALSRPDRVEKLIVEDMNVQKIPAEIFSMSAMFFTQAKHALQHVQNVTDEVAARKVLVDFIMKQLPEEIKKYIKPEVLEQNFPLQLKRSDDGSYAYKANLAVLEKATLNPSELMTDYAGVYGGPALFVYGKLSPFQVASDEPNIRKHFPNADFFGIEKASHAVYLDSPQEYTEAVLNFILME